MKFIKSGSDISNVKMLKYRKKCVAEKYLYLLYLHFLSGCHMSGTMPGPGEPKSTELGLSEVASITFQKKIHGKREMVHEDTESGRNSRGRGIKFV